MCEWSGCVCRCGCVSVCSVNSAWWGHEVCEGVGCVWFVYVYGGVSSVGICVCTRNVVCECVRVVVLYGVCQCVCAKVVHVHCVVCECVVQVCECARCVSVWYRCVSVCGRYGVCEYVRGVV